MILDLQTVKDYLGVDWDDESTNRRLTNLIKMADKYMTGSLGENYPITDERVQEMALIVIGQFYDNTDPIAKVSNSLDRLVHDLSLQLRMEMRVDTDEVQTSDTTTSNE